MRLSKVALLVTTAWVLGCGDNTKPSVGETGGTPTRPGVAGEPGLSASPSDAPGSGVALVGRVPVPWSPELPAPAARLSVSARDTQGGILSGPGPFPLESTAHLVFEVEWTGFFQDGAVFLQRVNLVTPNGGLYRSLPTKLVGSGGKAVGRVEVPVAGTTIEEYGLRGKWRADVFLDGVATVRAQATFLLE